MIMMDPGHSMAGSRTLQAQKAGRMDRASAEEINHENRKEFDNIYLTFVLALEQ